MENIKEIIEANYFEALLRAALLLSDLHRTTHIHEITVAEFDPEEEPRQLYPRCKLTTQDEPVPDDLPEENYHILFPIDKA